MFKNDTLKYCIECWWRWTMALVCQIMNNIPAYFQYYYFPYYSDYYYYYDYRSRHEKYPNTASIQTDPLVTPGDPLPC